MIEGCDTCSSPTICTKCLSSEAIFKDGYCQIITCEENEVVVDGACQHCEEIMVGCANCTSVDVCIECIDDEATIIADKCTCNKGFNADGTCKHSDS